MYTPNVAGANALLGEPPTTVGSSLTYDTSLKIYNVTLTQLATHSACINDKMIPANVMKSRSVQRGWQPVPRANRRLGE